MAAKLPVGCEYCRCQSVLSHVAFPCTVPHLISFAYLAGHSGCLEETDPLCQDGDSDVMYDIRAEFCIHEDISKAFCLSTLQLTVSVIDAALERPVLTSLRRAFDGRASLIAPIRLF